MTKISATVVADSINEFGHRITSMLLVMPRIILAEFNTHRMFSRNSASSRAIPLKKMVEMVQNDPFVPIKWMKEHTGMQGTEYFVEGERFGGPGGEGGGTVEIIPRLKGRWLWLRDIAIQEAQALNNSGVLYDPDGKGEKLTGDGHGLSKQMCNRLLEPWMWTTVLCTATEWENFFALRAHEAAEIHMQELAYRMLDAMNASQPKKLAAGEWHIPFGDQIDNEDLKDLYQAEHLLHYGYLDLGVDWSCTVFDKIRVKIATARAARTSYTLVGTEAKHDYAKDIKLHDRLLASGHLSPMEHCAKAMEKDHHQLSDRSRNFRGWIQYRSLIPNENKHDSRLLKK